AECHSGGPRIADRGRELLHRLKDDLCAVFLASPSAAASTPVLRQNSVRRQVIDLAGLIQRKLRLDGHPPGPPASTASPPLRRSPPCRPGKPGLAPPARRLQEDGDSAEGAQQRPTLVGRVVEGVGPLPAQTWQPVLSNHVLTLVALDFFTLHITRLPILYVLDVVTRLRRLVVNVNVTLLPTATWTDQKIVQAFTGDSAPLYLQRDGD